MYISYNNTCKEVTSRKGEKKIKKDKKPLDTL